MKSQGPRHVTRRLELLLGGLFVLLIMVSPGSAADPVRYALSDLRVLYLYDQPDDIDWGTIYYLNDQHGCRVDLVTLREGASTMETVSRLEALKLAVHRCVVSDTTPAGFDSLIALVAGDRPPDIVIFGDVGRQDLYRGLRVRLLARSLDSSALFTIRKVYQYAAGPKDSGDVRSAVQLNPHEKYELYRQRIKDEVPRLLANAGIEWYAPPSMIRYMLVNRDRSLGGADADFVSGLQSWQFPRILQACLADGAVKEAYLRRSKTIVSYLASARNGTEQIRAEALVKAYEETMALAHQVKANRALIEWPGIVSYIDDLASGVTNALMQELGIRWDGKIIVRDSPDGPRVKFTAALSAEGAVTVHLAQVRFMPYWDSTAVLLDNSVHTVNAHQTFVQEYLVDVDRKRLEAEQPESLLFVADVTTGDLSFPFSTALPIWETPDLGVKFQPGYYFIPPVAQLNVDKVVASMHWQAVISKPTYYRGTVAVNLETPKGMFAGAYQARMLLEKGRGRQSFSIPFSVSNLFELGVQQAAISVSLNGRVVAADTGRIRVAACEIADTVKIGFLPDSTGALEDILRMTGVGFQPLTDRALTTADLDAYNVIVIGSGAFRDFPSLRASRGRFEDYVRAGGSLVILGQPQDWPQGILPVELSPALEPLTAADVKENPTGTTLLSAPYRISQQGLLEGIDKSQPMAAAVITPGERLFMSPSGAAMLAVSPLGNGQIIYCGFPLTELIAALNIDAIHLFANLLNY